MCKLMYTHSTLNPHPTTYAHSVTHTHAHIHTNTNAHIHYDTQAKAQPG